MSQDARLDEELATQRRARVLNLDYVDTSKIVDKVLINSPGTIRFKSCATAG